MDRATEVLIIIDYNSDRTKNCSFYSRYTLDTSFKKSATGMDGTMFILVEMPLAMSYSMKGYKVHNRYKTDGDLKSCIYNVLSVR